jgi:hypothetical protein
MVSIKELISNVQVTVLEIEYRKSIHYLTPLIVRTEKALIKAQEEENPNMDRVNEIERAYRALVFIYGHLSKQDSRIKELENEVKLLNERLPTYGNRT